MDDNQSANLHCVGAYIQRDIYPDAKKMLDEYNAAWYNTDEESSEDLFKLSLDR